MSQPPTLPEPAAPQLGAMFPGGCYLLFNTLINWEAAEKLTSAAVIARNAGFNELTVCLSSRGGDPDQAFYILNVLRALPMKVTMHNVGGVRSAGNIVFMAGDERYASPGSQFFFHQTWFDGSGQQNTTSVAKRLQSIQKDDERTAELLASVTQQPETTVREWLTGDVTVDEAEAVQFGIAHAVKDLVIPANAYVERIAVS